MGSFKSCFLHYSGWNFFKKRAWEYVLVNFCYIPNHSTLSDLKQHPFNHPQFWVSLWADLSWDSSSLLHVASAKLTLPFAVSLQLMASLTCLALGWLPAGTWGHWAMCHSSLSRLSQAYPQGSHARFPRAAREANHDAQALWTLCFYLVFSCPFGQSKSHGQA